MCAAPEGETEVEEGWEEREEERRRGGEREEGKQARVCRRLSGRGARRWLVFSRVPFPDVRFFDPTRLCPSYLRCYILQLISCLIIDCKYMTLMNCL